MIKNKGFGLVELMLAAAIIGILMALILPTYHDYRRGAKLTDIPQICDFSINDFMGILAEKSVGAVLTASKAKESFLLVVTRSGVAFATAPVVTSTATLTAGAAATAYVALQSYCGSDEYPDWYTFSVEQVSKTFEIIHDQSGKIVDLAPPK